MRTSGMDYTWLVLAAVALRFLPTCNAAVRYEVSPGDSYFLAITGKSGLFSFAGHNHAILAPEWSTRITLDNQGLERSSAVITIPVSSLVIDSPEARKKARLGSGPSPEDVKTIQATMLGPEVLDAARYPAIELKTVSVHESAPDRLQVEADLTLHGQTRRVTVPVRYQQSSAGAFTFEGEFAIRQTDFNLRPASVAGGFVKVSNDVRFRFHLVAVPAP